MARKFLLSLFVPFLLAAPAAALDGQTILKQVDHNLQPGNLEMYRKLINIEPSGLRKQYLLWILKKDNDKIVALFISPASEKGRSTLRLGDNMWLYIPNVGRPIRITSIQSVIGGVFNNADIMRLDFSQEYRVIGMKDQGREYVLELKAKTNAVAYDRLLMWVLKREVVPTKIECYASTGMLIKVMYYKNIKNLGDGVVAPSVVETVSPLQKNYKSIMVMGNLKKRSISNEVFTFNYMPRVGNLR
jgi:outer membrane lipoprotein-sorting protein